MARERSKPPRVTSSFPGLPRVALALVGFLLGGEYLRGQWPRAVELWRWSRSLPETDLHPGVLDLPLMAQAVCMFVPTAVASVLAFWIEKGRARGDRMGRAVSTGRWLSPVFHLAAFFVLMPTPWLAAFSGWAGRRGSIAALYACSFLLSTLEVMTFIRPDLPFVLNVLGFPLIVSAWIVQAPCMDVMTHLHAGSVSLAAARDFVTTIHSYALVALLPFLLPVTGSPLPGLLWGWAWPFAAARLIPERFFAGEGGSSGGGGAAGSW